MIDLNGRYLYTACRLQTQGLNSMAHPIVIIGTGLAGYQLAREFRKYDQTTSLVLITKSEGHFYPKPQLSTALTQKKTSETLATSTAQAMEKQLNARVLTHTTVKSINTNTNQIQIDDQEMIYQKLILACGADVINPNLSGNAANDVISINHLEDYAVFEKTIHNKKNFTLLGAGLIGCEFANDLSNQGFEVHVIDPARSPLSLLIPEEIGALLREALQKNGVHFHFDCIAQSINKKNQDYELSLSNGENITTELVISAIGLRPHLSLAKQAGIETRRGVIVNAYLETNCENIYALGDCAEVEGHVLPYIAPILNAARSLAKTLAGERTAVDYPAMPIVIKTPAHPIAVCPPPKDMKGHWQIEKIGNDAKALFYNEENKLLGFVLTNNAVKERMALAAQLPKLI